eukprot:GHVU01007949.1.p3 GENE.GHVU01007949.1~~GHVU01007949.1.p3  ORF type:complete len:110 (-),score=17.44 GHVU01007949.1:575-904(-)
MSQFLHSFHRCSVYPVQERCTCPARAKNAKQLQTTGLDYWWDSRSIRASRDIHRIVAATRRAVRTRFDKQPQQEEKEKEKEKDRMKKKWMRKKHYYTSATTANQIDLGT